jgi:ABC-type glycerol-3-phosphate transport system substrate-binding protein
MKRLLNMVAATLAFCAAIGASQAQEISFFYPVAVGGPVTKIIDGYAADFARENPGIKVNPIYAGTYQETIVKALTAHKSGEPPVTSVLLSTDMFTLIDEDAIVPIDNFVTTAEDKAWLASFYPAFMANSRTGGKTQRTVPARRSSSTGTRSCQGSRLGQDKAPALGRDGRLCAEADQEGCIGQDHAIRRADSVVRLPCIVPGAPMKTMCC